MNRRDFTRLSAAALAIRLPALGQAHAQAQTQKPIGFAAIGLGTISDIFMRACASSQNAKITALVTGHPDEKGEKYAAQYGIPKSSIYTYETFDRIRDNPDVDAVYIGLPNSMHCEYTLRAAAARKHVLCEKPMAISSAECRQMIDACRKAGRKLMIAYRVHYDPTWALVQQIVDSGQIGQLQSFQGGFFNQQKPNWRLDRKLAGGGPILDLGIYPLNAIRHLTREEPTVFTAFTATRSQDERFAQVEQSMEWTMKFPSGILASCSCSYGQIGAGFLHIHGDKGALQVSPAFNYDGVHLLGRLEGGKQVDELGTGKIPFQFTLEADHFADCIRTNRQPESPGEEGLKDMLAIEAICRAAGSPIA